MIPKSLPEFCFHFKMSKSKNIVLAFLPHCSIFKGKRIILLTTSSAVNHQHPTHQNDVFEGWSLYTSLTVLLKLFKYIFLQNKTTFLRTTLPKGYKLGCNKLRYFLLEMCNEEICCSQKIDY